MAPSVPLKLFGKNGSALAGFRRKKLKTMSNSKIATFPQTIQEPKVKLTVFGR